jgi:hypothetical protein
VIVGTVAAGAQAAVGNVAAHGTVATLTSAGMGGYDVSVVASVTQAVGWAITGLGVVGAAASRCFG